MTRKSIRRSPIRKLQLAIYTATGRLIDKRRKAVTPEGCPDYQELRTQANALKKHTIDNLDYYLEAVRAQRRGARRQSRFLQGRARTSPISCSSWPRSAAPT